MANKGTCKANECSHEVIAKGYCRKHYRLWKAGEMPKPRYKTCTFEKCRKRWYRGSLCEEHFNSLRGTPAGAPAAAPAVASA